LAGDAPDLLRIVLDPAGAGERLVELPGCGRDGAAALIEDGRTGRCRALIDREDVTHRGGTWQSAPSGPCGQRREVESRHLRHAADDLAGVAELVVVPDVDDGPLPIDDRGESVDDAGAL